MLNFMTSVGSYFGRVDQTAWICIVKAQRPTDGMKLHAGTPHQLLGSFAESLCQKNIPAT